LGARPFTARRTEATFGAVAAMRACNWSVPPAVYRFLHGVPNGLLRLASTQVVMMSLKPMSLPPMPMVTNAVAAVTAVSCAGTGMPSVPLPA
jgi:hypothetical protein